MARTEGRTALILGPQDVDDLQAAIRCLGVFGPAPIVERPPDERLARLYRRLAAAGSRLERGRNGRSEAAA